MNIGFGPRAETNVFYLLGVTILRIVNAVPHYPWSGQKNDYYDDYNDLLLFSVPTAVVNSIRSVLLSKVIKLLSE